MIQHAEPPTAPFVPTEAGKMKRKQRSWEEGVPVLKSVFGEDVEAINLVCLLAADMRKKRILSTGDTGSTLRPVNTAGTSSSTWKTLLHGKVLVGASPHHDRDRPLPVCAPECLSNQKMDKDYFGGSSNIVVVQPDSVGSSCSPDDLKTRNWEIMFQRLLEYKLEHGDCRVPTAYEENCEGLPSKLGNWVLVQSRDTLAKARSGHTLYVERKRRLDAIGFEWESALNYRWDDMFQRLEKFFATYGHTRVPPNFEDDTKKRPSLGYWVRRQQTDIPPRVKAGKRLAIERKRRLDFIGFDWDRTFDLKWQEMFEILKRFKAEHGHTRVPLAYSSSRTGTSGSSSSAASGSNLGRWCHEQRKNIPEKLVNANDSVYEERKRQLDAIGFEWKTESEKDQRWNVMFERLKQFKLKHGHTRVPKTYKTYDGPPDGAAATTATNLAFWVRNQQDKVPKNAADGNPVFVERKKRLDRIGFEWTSAHTEQWETMFKRLVEYKKKYGNTRVPYRKANEVGGESSLESPQTMLGVWVYAQRTKLPAKAKEGNDLVSVERKQRLDKLGFEWDSALSSKWEVMFAGLRRFQAKTGHTRVPRTYKDEDEPLPANLGSWVITQRRTIAAKAETGDMVSIARKLCLDSLGFHWARSANKGHPSKAPTRKS